jgi:hypothetical protein
LYEIYIFFLILLLSATITFSQTTIKLEEISKHVGDSVKVCGKVYGIRYLEQSENSLTFINIGGSYPNQLLTVNKSAKSLWGLFIL